MHSRATTRGRILLTGAAGRIGRVVTAGLAGRYDLLLTDANPPIETRGFPFVQADISDAEQIRPLCRGINTVIHLAASSELETPWEALLRNNIIGLQHVFQAASESGCRRVIFASSTHVADGHPPGRRLPAGAPVLPLTLYGASKAWGEAVASVYARPDSLSAICLRLGWVLPGDDPLITLENRRLDNILTYDDLVRLIVASIEAPDGLHFGIFYGLSDNRRKRSDISDTRRLLHYQPRDDAFEIARNHEPGGARYWIRTARRAARRILGR